MKQGKKVVLISLEMSQDVYASRIDANLTGITTTQLLEQRETVRDQLTRVHQVHQGSQLIIKEMTIGVTTASDVATFIHNLKLQGFNPDIVVVDYINLMSSTRGNKQAGMYERVKLCAEELRAVAQYFDIVIWTATQLNRTGYGIVPRAEHTSESMGLVHT